MRNEAKTRAVLWLVCTLFFAACRMSEVDALSRGGELAADGGRQAEGVNTPADAVHGDAAAEVSQKPDAGHSSRFDAGAPDDSVDGGLSAPESNGDPDASAALPSRPDGSGVVAPAVDAAIASADAAPVDGPADLFVCPTAGSPLACVTFDYDKLVDVQNDPPSPWGWIEPLPWKSSTMDVVSLSGNKVLYAATTAVTADDTRARLGMVVPTTLTSLHVEYDFWSRSTVPQDYVEVLRFQQETPDGSYPGAAIAIAEEGFYASVSRYDGTKVNDWISPQAFSAPLLGRWIRISADFTFGLHGSLVVHFDGQMVFNNPDIAIDSVGATKSYLSFGLYSPLRVPFAAYFDNLLVTGT